MFERGRVPYMISQAQKTPEMDVSHQGISGLEVLALYYEKQIGWNNKNLNQSSYTGISQYLYQIILRNPGLLKFPHTNAFTEMVLTFLFLKIMK